MSDQKHDITIPSGRIRFALDALQKWENMLGCEVNMQHYHLAGLHVCYACLGGAAAFKRWPEAFKYRKEIFDRNDFHLYMDDPNTSFSEVIWFESSLDFARVGLISKMFTQMGLNYVDGFKYNRPITDYHENRDQFFADMHKLSDDLEKDGY